MSDDEPTQPLINDVRVSSKDAAKTHADNIARGFNTETDPKNGETTVDHGVGGKDTITIISRPTP